MKNFDILLLSLFIMAFSCSETLKPESSDCLSGIIIGNGCTAEGYLIEVTDLKDKDIEVGSVTIASTKYFNVIMSHELPGTDEWQIGDKIYFEISEIPVEQDSYICQDLYAAAPPYNLIRISQNNCL